MNSTYMINTNDANGNGTAYDELFLADNDTNGAQNEFIFTANFDGLSSQTYGGTTFLVHAAIGGSMPPNEFGVNGGWSGLRTTKSLVNKFPTGSIDVAGDTLPGDATSDTIQNIGQAEVELQIQDGLVVGANVVNGGFGFTKLPDLTINSDTGAGARLLPVLKFTKVDDASELAQVTQDAVVTVISCIEK